MICLQSGLAQFFHHMKVAAMSKHNIMAHLFKRRAAVGLYDARMCVISTLCLLLTTHLGYADAAQGLFVFGDSYADTGENMQYPFGMTWPGDGTAHRSSDGRNEVDFIAAKLGVASPTPWENGGNNGGVNFAVGGAAVTNAYGLRPLDQQVDAFAALVKGGTFSAAHLAQSVALVSIGVNDYTYYNQNGNGMGGLAAYVDTVVDKMGAQMERLHALGVRNIMVENLVPMSCMPFTTYWVNGETACVTNQLLDTETSMHDTKLQAKVNALNRQGANIAMLDLTKAMRRLFENGPAFGFTEAYKRCCSNSCSGTDFTVCRDPSKHVIFDSIHPTEAAWKAITNLYTYSQGFTKNGFTLDKWFQKNQLIN